MIRPPGRDGVAFSDAADGDMRRALARARVAAVLEIDPGWGVVRQVHGSEVVSVDRPGDAGEADAVWTAVAGVPISVLTADCLGVVLGAEDAVGVAHCGWRGVVAGVVGRLREAMSTAGHEPVHASIGPGIGSCCYEVGPEVAERFGPHVATTTWGALSVDLVAALRAQLAGLEVWSADECTRHGDGWFSHRRDGDSRRLGAIGWLR